jgi:hypothetical protein
MKIIFSLLLVATVFPVGATEILRIKKSYNPKNYLRYHAEVENCQLTGVYPMWVMGEESGQEEGLKFYERPFFKPKNMNISSNGKSMSFTFTLMNKIKNKLGVGELSVELINCKPKAYAEIEGKQIELEEIFVEGTGSGLGFKAKFLNVRGENPNGSKYFKKFAN